MKLLADQDVYALTVRHLRSGGHDVVTTAQRGQSRFEDAAVLESARAESRLLITRDRDFGELVFVKGAVAGVIYLRVLPATVESVHAELDRVLSLYTEAELQTVFVVIEPGRHRIRRIPVR